MRVPQRILPLLGLFLVVFLAAQLLLLALLSAHPLGHRLLYQTPAEAPANAAPTTLELRPLPSDFAFMAMPETKAEEQEALPAHCRYGAYMRDGMGQAWAMDKRSADPTLRRLRMACVGSKACDGVGGPVAALLEELEELRQDGEQVGRLLLVGDATVAQLAFSVECGARRVRPRVAVEFEWKTPAGAAAAMTDREARARERHRYAEWTFRDEGRVLFYMTLVPLLRGATAGFQLPPPETAREVADVVVLGAGGNYLPKEARLFRDDMARKFDHYYPRAVRSSGPTPLFFVETPASHYVSEGGEYDHRFSFDLGLSRAAYHGLRREKECLPRAPAFSERKPGGVYHGWRAKIGRAEAERAGFRVVAMNGSLAADADRAGLGPGALFWVPFESLTADAAALHPRTDDAGCLPAKWMNGASLFDPVMAGLVAGLRAFKSTAQRGTPKPASEVLEQHQRRRQEFADEMVRTMGRSGPLTKPLWDDSEELMRTMRDATEDALTSCPVAEDGGPEAEGDAPGEASAVALCTTFRNEAFQLLEWLAFHKAQGIGKVYACDDSSVDYSMAMVRPYLQSGFVELLGQAAVHAQHAGRTRDRSARPVQMTCIQDCMRAVQADPSLTWAVMIDSDEFLYPTSPTEDIGAQFPEPGQTPCARIPRVSYGAFPHFRRPRLLTTRAYVQRAEVSRNTSDESAGFRRNKWAKLAVDVTAFGPNSAALPLPAIHAPVENELREKCVDVGGLRMNHYTRSLEDWMLKVQTFNPTIGGARPRSVQQFLERQWREVEDGSAWERYGCRVAREMETVVRSFG